MEGGVHREVEGGPGGLCCPTQLMTITEKLRLNNIRNTLKLRHQQNTMGPPEAEGGEPGEEGEGTHHTSNMGPPLIRMRRQSMLGRSRPMNLKFTRRGQDPAGGGEDQAEVEVEGCPLVVVEGSKPSPAMMSMAMKWRLQHLDNQWAAPLK